MDSDKLKNQKYKNQFILKISKKQHKNRYKKHNDIDTSKKN